jgi:hypothetical protein
MQVDLRGCRATPKARVLHACHVHDSDLVASAGAIESRAITTGGIQVYPRGSSPAPNAGVLNAANFNEANLMTSVCAVGD